MRFGIVGLGSIGQRHARCLKVLGYTDIAALRTGKGEAKSLPRDLSFIKEYSNADEFYSRGMGCVIISNPTSLHIEAMKRPLGENIPIFVEKPLSDSFDSLKGIEGLDTSRVLVGYCLRHNNIIKAVAGFLSSGRLGKVYKAKLYCGHYLPHWHPGKDYRKEYSARKDLGGGALRTLSHEIDLMLYLFGDAKRVSARVEKLSDLEMDADDSAVLTCEMNSGAVVNIELDFLNPVSKRHGTITGSKGVLEYNFNTPKVTFTGMGGEAETIFEDPEPDWNAMYMEQMRDMIGFINEESSISCDYEGGVAVMRIIHAAERSSLDKSFCDIAEEGR